MSEINRPMMDAGEAVDLTRDEHGMQLTPHDIKKRAAVLLHHFGWSVQRVASGARMTTDEIVAVKQDDSLRQYVRSLNIPIGVGLSAGGMSYR